MVFECKVSLNIYKYFFEHQFLYWTMYILSSLNFWSAMNLGGFLYTYKHEYKGKSPNYFSKYFSLRRYCKEVMMKLTLYKSMIYPHNVVFVNFIPFMGNVIFMWFLCVSVILLSNFIFDTKSFNYLNLFFNKSRCSIF